MFGIIITVIICVAIIDTLFNKDKATPADTQLEQLPQQETALAVVQEDQVIVDDERLAYELLVDLADKDTFLNVMVGKKIFRLEQVQEDVVRIRECLSDLVGQIRYSNVSLETGTLYSVSSDMLFSKK